MPEESNGYGGDGAVGGPQCVRPQCVRLRGASWVPGVEPPLAGASTTPLSLNAPTYHWARWTSVLGQFAALQFLVQVLTALTGFLLVRRLDKVEYALFTLASTVTASLSVLSDSGLAAATLAIGGEVWQDKPRLLRLVHESIQMRTRIGLWGLLLIGPWALWLLTQSQASPIKGATLTLVSILAFWSTAATQLASTTLRLHSSFRDLQRSELLFACLRFVITGVLVVSAALSSTTALLAVFASALVQWTYVHQKQHALLGSAMDSGTFKRRLVQSVRHMMPNSAFLCIQGNLVTWLLATLAPTSDVADLGALSRLAVVFAVIASPLHQVITPAFARCKDMPQLRRLFALTLGGFAAFAAAVLIVCWGWPTGPLWLLGPQYGSLSKELPVYMLGLGITGISGVFWALNFSRGWTRHVSWNIPVSIVTTIVAISICDLATVNGAALFTCVSPVGSLLLGAAITFRGLK